MSSNLNSRVRAVRLCAAPRAVDAHAALERGRWSRRQATNALDAGGDEPECKMNAVLSDIHGAQPVEFVID